MLVGILLVAKDRSSTCANIGKMEEDLLEGSQRIKQKYGHINHKEEIYKSRFQNQQNSGTSLPLELSLYASCLCLFLYIIFILHPCRTASSIL